MDGDHMWTLVLEGPGCACRRPGGRAEREVRGEVQGRGEAGLGAPGPPFEGQPGVCTASSFSSDPQASDWRKPGWQAVSSLSTRSLASYLWPVSWLIKIGISSIRAHNDACFATMSHALMELINVK